MRTTQHGFSRPTGDFSGVAVRDLRDLRDRPIVVPVPKSWFLRNFLNYRRREIPADIARMFLGRVPGIIQIESSLSLIKHFGDGRIQDFGVVSRRLVTNNGVAFIVDAFQNLVELENMKFHGFGTGTNAEAQADSALQTELTTQYATDNVRPTGTTEEGASANIFKSVATLAPDSGGTIAITEHMLLSQAATGGGVGFDRSVFAAVNLVAGSDSLVATYQLTINAGN